MVWLLKDSSIVAKEARSASCSYSEFCIGYGHIYFVYLTVIHLVWHGSLLVGCQLKMQIVYCSLQNSELILIVLVQFSCLPVLCQLFLMDQNKTLIGFICQLDIMVELLQWWYQALQSGDLQDRPDLMTVRVIYSFQLVLQNG